MLLPTSKDQIILITGGNGFIGSHVAKRLHDDGYTVRIADLKRNSAFKDAIAAEVMVGDLCDPLFCRQAMYGVKVVLHFAAVMGGMGTIHKDNDLTIYRLNHDMTMNVLSTAIAAGVSGFFLASTACVYPNHLQSSDDKDVSLRESDVWKEPPPTPQGLYGLEKLAAESLLRQSGDQIDFRIARFHNVFGPKGSWRDGHEKAPAALLRKAHALRLTSEDSPTMEIWGTGTQRRSFLYIDDAVAAVIRLLRSDYKEPLNIGSNRSVTIHELAQIALQSAGVDSTSSVRLIYDTSKPIGVSSRNSNNDLVYRTLGWKPEVPLERGMQETSQWMRDEINDLLVPLPEDKARLLLNDLCQSQLIHLDQNVPSFAILLPITSRGSASPQDCLRNLAIFAKSLARTTWRDTQPHCRAFRTRIYLAVDEDDEFLQDGEKPERLLRAEGFTAVTTLTCDYPKGHVCSLWRHCAQAAWKDGCDYFILMGDDVELLDADWMGDIDSAFRRISEDTNAPFGFGCVAFKDITFPGMPTFPVVHRTHMDVFGGEVIPDFFINQDGDPYLFQLYRRFGASSMLHSQRIRNSVGGSLEARYKKQSATDWTFEPLTLGTRRIEEWFGKHALKSPRKLSIDVIVPCYRVQLPMLKRILELKPSSTCTVMFIIIVDDPSSPNIHELEFLYGERPDVRIRINAKNMGASASRNRGLKESSAEWVHFLDDDVVPHPDLLVEAENIIRAFPDAAGFVGNAQFPVADTIPKAAVHLAGVTYFWDIATKIDNDVPWGVTANLIARRDFADGVTYNPIFPKTGGGEDIDFCLKKRRASLERGGEGFRAAPKVIVTHPWWNAGSRDHSRFSKWAKGDGALVKLYPEFCYEAIFLNGGETFLCCLLLFGISVISMLTFHPLSYRLALISVKMTTACALSNVGFDLYKHLWRKSAEARQLKITVSGVFWILAILESTVIRMKSEMGRLVGKLERGEIAYLLRRFDWFVGRWGQGPIDDELQSEKEIAFLFVMFFAILLYF